MLSFTFDDIVSLMVRMLPVVSISVGSKTLDLLVNIQSPPNDFNFKWSKIDPKEMQSFLVDIQRKGEEDELIKEENHQVQSIYQE